MRTTTILLTLAALAACEPHRNPFGGGTSGVVSSVDERGVLLLDGLGDLGPHIQAAMGTAEDRAKRAPYSPEGWPLWPDEIVSWDRARELDAEYEGWLGVSAPFWVGKIVFGAQFTGDKDAGAGTDGLPNFRYIGHFPDKTKYELWPEYIPQHLAEKILTQAGFQEVGESIFKLEGSIDIGELQLIWTRERWLEGYTGKDEDQ